MTIHKEGYASIFLAFCLASGFVWAALGTEDVTSIIFWILAGGATVLFLLIVWFFRFPNRVMVGEDGQIICPSDGKIVVIEKVVESEYFQEERIQISIFMSPLNVHAQWYPFAGSVRYKAYHKGKYLVAWHPKSSELNERSSVVVEEKAGRSVLVRQIAGAVARRIVTYAKEGKDVEVNEQLGFIKFGSRIDVFLPVDANVLCRVDDKVQGNKTVLATFH